MAKAKYVFLNEEIVPWDEAKVHVATVAFKFGTAVFEGLRGYWNENEKKMYLLLLDAHMRRLAFSQRFMRFEEPLDTDYVGEKILELVRANGGRLDLVTSTTAGTEFRIALPSAAAEVAA